MSKRIFSFLLFCLIAFATARFCHRETAGFKMTSIENNLFPGSDSNVPEDFDKVESILNQKFTYLGRGLQSFAFVSEDQKYVLKLLNNQYQRRIFWHGISLPFFHSWQEKKKNLYQKKLEKTYASYQLAFSELKNETGLIYLHLHPTHLFPNKATIIDKIGIAHEIDLDKTGFILQKKAELAYPYLAQLKKEGKLEQAKEAIRSYLQLLESRCQRGIADSDPLIRTNLGFVDNQPCLIDVGPFSKNSDIQDSKVYKKEILRITASLRDWLDHHFPELLSFFDKEMNEVL